MLGIKPVNTEIINDLYLEMPSFTQIRKVSPIIKPPEIAETNPAGQTVVNNRSGIK